MQKLKVVEKDFGKDLDYIKSFTDNKKQVIYINTGFKGGESKVYTINLNLGEDKNNE